jgi:hypothetical protein
VIDNFEIIKPLLDFSEEDKFYFLQIIQRRKENPEVPSNNRVIKNYFFNNMKYLERKWDEIKGLCEFFNARAMLRLNRRSYETVAYRMLRKVAEVMEQKSYNKMKSNYAKVCGTCHAEKEKTWIVDIDEFLGQDELGNLCNIIDSCEPKSDLLKMEETFKELGVDSSLTRVDTKIVAEIPSLNGLHLITRPFNVKQFRDMEGNSFRDVDIQKDNPTNIYIS